MDWNSFWINIYAGAIYFVLGILFSIWLIPRFTLNLLKRKNIIHFRKKVTFIIAELCDFVNHMPNEFKINDESLTVLVKNKKYPDLFDFVALMKPNILKPVAPEKLKVRILETITNYSGEKRFELVNSELSRLKSLQESLESILSAHSLNIDDKLIASISSLCFDIRLMQNKFRFNYTHEELTGQKEGISGADKIDKIYDQIIDLLKELLKEKGIEVEK